MLCEFAEPDFTLMMDCAAVVCDRLLDCATEDIELLVSPFSMSMVIGFGTGLSVARLPACPPLFCLELYSEGFVFCRCWSCPVGGSPGFCPKPVTPAPGPEPEPAPAPVPAPPPPPPWGSLTYLVDCAEGGSILLGLNVFDGVCSARLLKKALSSVTLTFLRLSCRFCSR